MSRLRSVKERLGVGLEVEQGTSIRIRLTLMAVPVAVAWIAFGQTAPADAVLSGGKILAMDAKDDVHQAVATRDRQIIASGTDRQIRTYIGKQTKVIQLSGKTVVPGLIESRVHAFGISREEADQSYAELSSIAEIHALSRTM